MEISSELQQVLKASTFKVHLGEWVYAKVASVPSLDDCFMVSKDDDEITAVFELEKSPKMNLMEQNKDRRKLIEVRVSEPFYAVGFLAAITGAISERDCNNLVVSTYSKDYILVTFEHYPVVREALMELGLAQV